MVIFVNFAQYAKAISPILVTEVGIVTSFRFAQPLNAPLPIVFTEFEIVTLLKFSQLEKA